MDKLNLMTSFIAVAEEGSFTAAANRLGKTKALISTHISQLEDLLKVRLLIRSTRSMQITSEGQSYYEQAKKILDDIVTLEAQLLHESQSLVGRLRISAPTTFGELVLMPCIAELTSANPELKIELLLNDRFVDLISEGFDVALRIGNLADSSLIARPAGFTRMFLCASPEFIEHYGEPESIHQLAELPCVFDTNYRHAGSWSFTQDQREVEVRPHITARVNSALAAANMARTGRVITYCPEFAVHAMLEKGELISLLPHEYKSQIPVNVIYPHRQHLSTRVTIFTQYFIDYWHRMTG
ncbi:LysR family transcriptional regulator [Amphritea sp.]|uniref:LysR family transcriptional regulator n=1 Tax=Amphritea sp. TaxID=1872502 RepID=UPI0025C324C4|nr:LysR family transcriptional regulator [Amphritea sp.]